MEHSKYGDEFNVGDTYTTAAITMTETHVVNWAGLTMDFYFRLMDVSSIFGINDHGTLTVNDRNFKLVVKAELGEPLNKVRNTSEWTHPVHH